jgi:hypothetical protein
MEQGRPTHRGGTLGLARKLAKSGTYSSADAVLTVIGEVDQSVVAAKWFSDSRFRAQLTKLCELAQQPRSALRGGVGE